MSSNGVPDRPQTPDEIERDIELKREQLAGTIDALSAKLDVKSQAKAKVAGVRADVEERKEKANPDVVAAGAAVVAMVVTALMVRSRR